MLLSQSLRVLHPRFCKNLSRINTRHFLSPAYKCQESWNNRLMDKHLKTINPLEFYYDLIRKYKREGRFFAIDADIFFNSIDIEKAKNLIQEIEEGTLLLRSTPENVNMLPSTNYAIPRLLFELGNLDTTIQFVSVPHKFGIFLDFHMSNLYMDEFLKKENYTDAARIASHLMLQEDFGPELTKTFALLSCIKFVLNGEGDHPWIDFDPPNEPEEEVKIRVQYLRNPYFDDHFDLKNPIHIVGKTLAWLSMHLDKAFKSNSAILGWSLFEKWSNLETNLQEVLTKKLPVDDRLMKIVEDNLEKCENEEIKKRISSLLVKMKGLGLSKDFNFEDLITEHLKRLVKETEESDIKNQEAIFSSWIDRRDECVKDLIKIYERERLLDEIEKKKKDLEEREEILFFFENKDKIEMKIPKGLDDGAAKTRHEAIQELLKSDDYVVPEMGSDIMDKK